MQRNNKRGLLLIFGGFVCLLLIIGLANSLKTKPTVLQTSEAGSGGSGTAVNRSGSGAVEAAQSVVPWDYKIDEATVGDLIGADMTILPNNQLLANDDNYATGDKVWVLSYMSADMAKRDDGKNNVQLSAWTPIKSYRSREAAQNDLDSLKLQIQTDVPLIGVYKTEFQGKYRQFAMLTLPSGHSIKQPISEERYNILKDKKQVKVLLEEVHDFADYDLAMAKFRGWAE